MIALITGATSEIGEATAKILAECKYDLIITGRRHERLKSLKKEIIDRFGVRVVDLCFDVRDRDKVVSILNNLPEDFKNIDILVNNAGLASGLESVQDGDYDDWDKMIDTNIKGLLYVSKIVANIMKVRNKGHIINIGSIAGKEVYPNGVVYCATKHAVDAISKGLRLDLVKYGIKVSQICPGAVEIEFSEVRFHGDQEKAANVHKGFTPLIAEDIAEVLK